jgi:uncharacterized protein (TIGR00251 family)
MRKLESKFSDAQQGAAITVKVSPRAKRTEFAEVMDDGTLKIKVAAAPEDGAANATLIAFLAEAFHIPASQIEIVVGQSSEKKLISLVGVSPAMVEDAVAGWLVVAQARADKKNASKKAKPAKKK